MIGRSVAAFRRIDRAVPPVAGTDQPEPVIVDLEEDP